jgi:hypothetical protein
MGVGSDATHSVRSFAMCERCRNHFHETDCTDEPTNRRPDDRKTNPETGPRRTIYDAQQLQKSTPVFKLFVFDDDCLLGTAIACFL